ncbi:hypothetical protein XA68_10174 [Ophiocordyceps unilateralis]|uniref:Myb-like domain-containing protein n=1 Tax=Ophiocordyceps unilateralis TaxID=268505 RepID=A0A2A9P311_OPHUN|nr:hypothetical protein XA68_10174 [Ophiocordyceps unilateralis]
MVFAFINKSPGAINRPQTHRSRFLSLCPSPVSSPLVSSGPTHSSTVVFATPRRRLARRSSNQRDASQGRALQPVAELAQLKSQTLLCLPRAEPPFSAITNADFGLRRGPGAIVNSNGSGHSAGRRGNQLFNVDIDSLLKPDGSNESPGSSNNPQQPPRPVPVPRPTASPVAVHGPPPPSSSSLVRAAPPAVVSARRSMPPQLSDQPVKKQSKWSPDEDALIIELRGSGMKWEDVSKRLPGRSAISCRLHYQNYLERRSEWDEERKNKLARLYERFKSEMWAKVAEELAVPWRAAEAMHWQLGEADMARRAGVVPFSLAAVNVESGQQRGVASRAGTHYQPAPDVSVPRHLTPPSPRSMYTRGQPLSVVMTSGGQAVRPEPPMTAPPPPVSAPGLPPSVMADHGELYYTAGPGLAPIQTQGQPRNPGPLPSLAELTTGVSPYGASVEQRPRSGPRGGGPPPTQPGNPNMLPAAPQAYPPPESTRPKRRASPESMQRETSLRRRIG